MPMMRWRVVCALKVAILMRSPTNWFMSVLLPTLGLPTMFTNPALCISNYLNEKTHTLISVYERCVDGFHM